MLRVSATSLMPTRRFSSTIFFTFSMLSSLTQVDGRLAWSKFSTTSRPSLNVLCHWNPVRVKFDQMVYHNDTQLHSVPSTIFIFFSLSCTISKNLTKIYVEDGIWYVFEVKTWKNFVSHRRQYMVSIWTWYVRGQILHAYPDRLFIWFDQIFIWFTDSLIEWNKFYFIQMNDFFNSKKVFQKNNFLWLNQIFFLSATKLSPYPKVVNSRFLKLMRN